VGTGGLERVSRNPKICAKQQGGFVRCVPVRLTLAASRDIELQPSELFPGLASLRYHCIRNSIECKPEVGQGKRNDI
jgi:hypothetical protein